MRAKFGKNIQLFITCSIIVVCLITSAWAGLIEGRDFVIKPWVPAQIFTATNGYALIRLGYQIENESYVEVRLTDMNLKWEVHSTNPKVNYNKYGTIRLEQSGTSPFNQIKVWPHGAMISPIADMTTPPVVLKVPKGQYSYVISLVNPIGNAIELSSNLLFEVK